jgi:FixJ family two-component response regulator
LARDVLIVDDDKNALANYGNRIRLALGIEPFLAYDPYQALNILRLYSIKVLVTDEDMARMRGTELVRQVRTELGLTMPCIMFTGFANQVDMTSAIKIEDLRFLDKSDVRRLADEVRDALGRYRQELGRTTGTPVDRVIQRQQRFIVLRRVVKTTHVARIMSIEEYSRDNEWFTIHRAERGKGVATERSFAYTVKSSVEVKTDDESSTRLNVKVADLSLASLAASIEDKVHESVRNQWDRQFELSTKETVTVEQIPDPPARPGLRTREYQCAPVYRRFDLEVYVECSCCGLAATSCAQVDVPTERIALRVVEHFDIDPSEVYYTGYWTGNLAPA